MYTFIPRDRSTTTDFSSEHFTLEDAFPKCQMITARVACLLQRPSELNRRFTVVNIQGTFAYKDLPTENMLLVLAFFI